MPLNSKQQKAIPILLGADSVEDAARKSGIARGTLHGWLKKPEFAAALAESRKAVLNKAMQKLVSTSMKAVITLEGLLTAENEGVRRAAANDILQNAIRWREISEIEDRLQSVERIILERRVYNEHCKTFDFIGEGH